MLFMSNYFFQPFLVREDKKSNYEKFSQNRMPFKIESSMSFVKNNQLFDIFSHKNSFGFRQFLVYINKR